MTDNPRDQAPIEPTPGERAARTVSVPGPFALAAILASLAMLGPFSIDGYLPAFPDIAESLGASALQVQQTLTAYLVSFSFMILWHGALSDALGRRNVILVALAVFVVASFGCAAAHSIGYLWGFRVLQGTCGGAGVVIGRAMIRDHYEGHEAQRLFSLVTMIFAIGPAIAPIIGGWIVAVFDWRAIFLALSLYSAGLFVFCWYRLPETLPVARRQRLHLGSLATSYRRVLSDGHFHLFAGIIAFNFAGLFLFVAASPTLLIKHLGLNSQQFFWLFGPMVSGIFLGALANNRLAGRWRIPMQVRIGFVLMIAAALFQLTYHLALPARVPWSVVSIFFYSAGMAITGPGVTLLVLDLFPEVRGVVASCQAFAQTLLSSLIAGAIAPWLAPSMVWLAAGQLSFVCSSWLLWQIASRYARTHGTQ